MQKPPVTIRPYYVLLASALVALMPLAGLNLAAQAKMSKSKGAPVEDNKPASQPDDPGCKECLKNATKLFATGKAPDAIAALQAWQDRCPGNLQMQLLLNTMLLRDPKGKDLALKAAQRACQIDPQSMVAHFQTALTYNMMGDMQNAKSEYETVVSLDPANYEAWLSLAEIYGGLKESDKETEARTKAQNLDPKARATRLKMVQTLDRAGRTQSVREELAKIAADPTLPAEAYMAIGQDAMTMGYFAESVECFNRFLQAHSTGAASIKPLSLMAMAQYFKQDDKLSDTISRLKSQGGDKDARVQALQGLRDLDQGQYETGKGLIEQAGATQASDPVVAYATGRLYLKQGQYTNAVEKLEDAARANPALSASKLWVALAAYKNGDYIECMGVARDCARVKDMAARAQALELRGKVKEGNAQKQAMADLLQTVEAAQRNKTDDPEINLALGYYDLFARDLSSARERFTKALEAAPGNEDAMIALARISKKEGNNEAAGDMLKKALAIAPGDKEALEVENNKDNALK